MTAVAIQGEAGSFSHAAALDTHGPATQLVPCATFEDLFDAVTTGAASRGIVPIENTSRGRCMKLRPLERARFARCG
jgi:prephenate dehydratase